MQRLKTRSQFQAVLAGDRVASTAHFVLHRRVLGRACRTRTPPAPADAGQDATANDEICFGAMVPKRWAKRAVTRNSIKRQIYSVSSEVASSLPVAAHVVRLRATFDRAFFTSASSRALKQAVREELMRLFADAMRITAARRAHPDRQR